MPNTAEPTTTEPGADEALRARVTAALAELEQERPADALALAAELSTRSERAADDTTAALHVELHRVGAALAAAHAKLGDPIGQASTHLATALAAARRAHRPELAAAAARAASGAHARADRLSEARSLAEQGLAEDLGHHGAVLSLQVANVELATGRLARAEQYLDAAHRALADAASAPNAVPSPLEVHLDELRGRLYLDLGMIDLAHAAFQRVAARIGGENARVQMLALEEALAAEDFATALTVATALTERKDSPLPRADVELRMAIARARLEPEHTGRARALLSAALAKAMSASTRVRVQLRLADLCLDGGDDATAAGLAAEARTGLAGFADIDTVRERTGLVVVEARCLLARPHASPAELDAAAQALLSAQAESLAEWEQHAPRPGGVGYLRVLARRDLLSMLIDVERRRAPDDPSPALDHLLATQARGSAARRLGLETPTLERVRRELVPVNGGILVYLPAGTGSHVFAIGALGLTHHRLPPSTATRAYVRQLRDLLHAPPPASPTATGTTAAATERATTRDARLRTLAQRVADHVLPTALRAQIEPWRELIVVGRDMLAQLPFEALPGEDAPWLGLERAISYWPSLPIAFELRRRAKLVQPRPLDLLLVAATKPARLPGREPLVDLELGVAELAPLLAPFAASTARIGFAASRTSLLGENLGGVSALLLLAHGVTDGATAADERPTALMLARSSDDDTVDGRLRCGDVEAFANVPPLALLLACGASAGPDRRGEDQGADLVGAFLNAGACATVASDAELEVDASMRLMARTNQELAHGVPLAESLRRARASLALDPAYADPAFHATMHVTGLGDIAFPFRPAAYTPASLAAARPSHAWPLAFLALGIVCTLTWIALVLCRRAPRG